MKSKILKIFLVILLFASFLDVAEVGKFASISFAENQEQTQTTAVENIEQNELPQNNKQIDNKQPQTSASTQFSIPEKNFNSLKQVGKNIHNNKFLKFVMAMLLVTISAIIVYCGLRYYKNYIANKNGFAMNTNNNKSLEAPSDYKTAINLFLKKTEM